MFYDDLLLSQAGREGLPMAKLGGSGRDGSRSEVLRRLSILDASLARGLADAEAGRVKPAADVFDRLEDKYRRLVNRTA
jgi:antitoxin ParD1/3/4